MKKYSYSLFIFLLIAFITSCKKDFLSLETNPNTPSVASPSLLLSGALKTTAGIVNGGGARSYSWYACWMGYMSYSTGYQTSSTLEQYNFTASTWDVWTPLYLNLTNYDALVQSNSGPYFTAIAKIMEVYNFQALVDNYNNVPYTQALKGTKNFTPVYDKGSDIYDDLMKQLDAAIVLIKGATPSALNPGPADIMFKGNMTNWSKFANTLKLKLAIRQSNLSAKSGALKAAVAATQSIGYIDATNSAEVNPGYLNSDVSGGQQSPIWLAYGSTQSGAGQDGALLYQANSYAVNFFYSNKDTARGKQLYLPNASGNVISTYFGDRVPPAVAPSKFGPGVLKAATMSAKILSSSESLFLQSEGVASGLITGDAAALYTAGIAADFVDIGLTAAQAATYSAQPTIAYPSAGTLEQQKKAIITQKWAALDVYGAFEAYNEFRRTGYPSDIPLSKTPPANAPNQITRIFYPFIESSTNAANLAAQGTIDKFTSKIFWAK